MIGRAAVPLFAIGGIATPAAADPGLKPIIDARLRYEAVEQKGGLRGADAVTGRMRACAVLSHGDFALLAEAEATLGLVNRYNSGTNGRTAFAPVADPRNVELNRLQLAYRGLSATVVTLGRQRINLDDQRFVGAVSWRQNEQTFDALRIETTAIAPLSIDLTYAWSDQTIFGVDSPIQSIPGDTLLANAGLTVGPVKLKGFAYLIDQDRPGRRQFSSQTFGVRASASLPLGGGATLAVVASYARQRDWRRNPNDYAADYWLAEVTFGWRGLSLTGGYEVLGADGGRAHASFQTPLATGHKFQGWADKFLATPADGIRDLYAGAGYAAALELFGPVSLQAVWHWFESDRLNRDYGTEWNVQLGFKASRQVGVTLKYADYDARGFSTDTRKFWFQLDYVL